MGSLKFGVCSLHVLGFRPLQDGRELAGVWGSVPRFRIVDFSSDSPWPPTWRPRGLGKWV